jgi:hypothetical protein
MSNFKETIGKVPEKFAAIISPNPVFLPKLLQQFIFEKLPEIFSII